MNGLFIIKEKVTFFKLTIKTQDMRNIAPPIKSLTANPVQQHDLEILFRALGNRTWDCEDEWDATNFHAALLKFIAWHKDWYLARVKSNGYQLTEEQYQIRLAEAMADWPDAQ